MIRKPISEWPSVASMEHNRLPSRPGIYAIVGIGGDILYIGEAAFLRGRFISHETAKRVEQPFRIAYYVTDRGSDYGTLNRRRKSEAKLIERYKPPFNQKQHHRPQAEIEDARCRAAFRLIDLLTKHGSDFSVWQLERAEAGLRRKLVA